MGWFVRRNGEVSGPFDDATIAGWVQQGMTDAAIQADSGGEWIPVVYSPFAHLIPTPRPASGGGGGSTVAIVCIALVLLVGGCTFIVAEPVVALAIFFVGIPFVFVVLWLTGALLVGPNRR